PCEDGCVLSLIDKAVTIKNVELAVIEKAFEEGWVKASPADRNTGRNVAVVGSGPAGLACAHSLRDAGHALTVYERSDRVGGLVRYGVPDYKMEKRLIDRRVAVMEQSGVKFVTGCHVGKDVSMEDLRAKHDAVAVCIGSLQARDLTLPGRELPGVTMAMDYLTAQNRACAGDPMSVPLDAKGKNVVILGGGDTGADCFGTAIRQGATSVVQLNHYPEPDIFAPSQVWPLTDSTKHAFVYDEGGVREWGVQAVAFRGSERVEGVEMYQVKIQGRLRVPIPNSLRTVPADLVLLAIGFEGAELSGIGLGTDGEVLKVGADYQTSTRGVFAAGDVRRGASLIVWAIAEGLNCAASIDRFLTGESRPHRSFAATEWAGLGRT
ncbi:MAG: glutamate synthase subunit beta, partial [bacterium]